MKVIKPVTLITINSIQIVVYVQNQLMNPQLRDILEVITVPQPQQSGFRPAHSTVTAATATCE